ncbi:MAG: hypothetical protein ABUL77_00510 [Bacteroidota bacterium]
MPNLFASLALATFPVFAIALFLFCRPRTAVALTLMIGEMVLPANHRFDFPLIPPLDKQTIPILAAMLGAALFGRKHLRRPLRGSEWFLVALIVSAFWTVRTNGDPLRFGPTRLPGETSHDFISETIRIILYLWAPFYLGRCFFTASRDLIALGRMMTVGALIYTLPILVEIRLSPQLCQWFYGYSAAGFDSVFRWGGYRPVVFFVNGLFLSVFMLFCTTMTAAMTKARKRIAGLPALPLCLFLCFIVLICKSTGTIVYMLVFLPLLAFRRPSQVMSIAAIMSIFVLTYPLLRIWDIIPTARIGELVSKLSADRADSLMYRFHMEQGLLDRLRERVAFGWGGYGRNFIWAPWGQQLTVVDGYAIIELSTKGLVGYTALFGMFLTPVIRALRLFKHIKERSSRYLVCGLTLVIAILMLDFTVNAPLNPFLTMLVGALSGAVPGIITEEKRSPPQQVAAPRAREDERFVPGAPQPSARETFA